MHPELVLPQPGTGSFSVHETVPSPTNEPLRRRRTGTPRTAPVKRSVSSMVRFTSDEWHTIADRARVCGRVPAVYIREAALGAAPKARRVPEHADLVRQLADLGNTLTALVQATRSGAHDDVAQATERVLDNVLDAVRRVG